jgi:hypothetical protein
MALAAAAVAGIVFTFAGASLADTQHIDGDIGNNTPNLMYGPGHNDCTTLGDSVSAALKLHFDGNPNDPTAHFDAGKAVTLSFADGPGGTATASSAGIVESQTVTTNVPSPWNQSSADFTVPFSVTVPSGTADGTYQVEVSASGTNGSGGPYSPSGGRPLFIIHVGCAASGGGGGPTNQPPTVSEISGDTSAYEGDTKTYSITESDPDVGDTLSNSWSITGNAEIVDSNTGTSVSVHFTDGPSPVTLQAEVNDGNTHIVTKSLSISEMNVAPSVTLSSSNGSSFDESATAQQTFSYSISDPGDDHVSSVTTSCGSGDKVTASFTDTAGSFKCMFLDGPASTQISAAATDDDGDLGSAATANVTVNNVPPSISGFTISGGNAVACQGATNTVGIAFAVSDPADQAHDPITGTITWGDSATTSIAGRSISTSHNYSAGSYTLSVSVNDGDGGTASAGGGSSANVVLLYSTGQGILQPINYTGPRSLFKLGSTIPVKVKITDCNNNPVSTLSPQVSLTKLDGSPDGTSIEDVVSTVPDQGTTMRFTGSPDYQYIYNLGTKNLSQGDLKVTVSDATIAAISAYFSLKK